MELYSAFHKKWAVKEVKLITPTNEYIITQPPTLYMGYFKNSRHLMTPALYGSKFSRFFNGHANFKVV